MLYLLHSASRLFDAPGKVFLAKASVSITLNSVKFDFEIESNSKFKKPKSNFALCIINSELSKNFKNLSATSIKRGLSDKKSSVNLLLA